MPGYFISIVCQVICTPPCCDMLSCNVSVPSMYSCVCTIYVFVCLYHLCIHVSVPSMYSCVCTIYVFMCLYHLCIRVSVPSMYSCVCTIYVFMCLYHLHLCVCTIFVLYRSTYGIVHEKRDLVHVIKKCYKNGITFELL